MSDTSVNDDFGPPIPVQQGDDFGPPVPVAAPASDAVQLPRPTQDASLAAFKARAAGLTADQGAQALRLASDTGLGPSFVAQSLEAVRTNADDARMKTALASAPVAAAWAAQSPAHAAAVKEDAEQLSTLEYWITGKWRTMPGPAIGAVGPYALQQTTHEEMVALPFWQAAVAKAVFGGAEGLLITKKAIVGLTDAETQRLSEDAEFADAPVPDAAGSTARETGATIAGALPGLLLAPGAKPAQATYFTLQAFPGYYKTLRDAVDENGDPRWSDGAAKSIASGAALINGIGSTLLGSAFLKSIPGAAKLLNGAMGESLVSMFTENPNIAKLAFARGVQAVPHMASGVAMMTATGTVNGTVQAMANGHSLLSPEGRAEIVAGAKGGAKQGAMLSLLALYGASARFKSDLDRLDAARGPEVTSPEAAPGQPLLAAPDAPTIETTATESEPPPAGPSASLVWDLGRATDAAVETRILDEMVSAAKEVNLVKAAPQEAQRLISGMAEQGLRDTVFVHPVATGNPDVAASIDAALEDDGQARALAQTTGSTIAVPLEKYLTIVAPDHHDEIRDHVKLTPDGMTPGEAREAAPAIGAAVAAFEHPASSGAPAETAAVEPQPAIAPGHIEAAQAVIENQAIGQIHPAQHALAARQASDKLAAIQAAAIERLASAEHLAQEGIDKGIEGSKAGQKAGTMGLSALDSERASHKLDLQATRASDEGGASSSGASAESGLYDVSIPVDTRSRKEMLEAAADSNANISVAQAQEARYQRGQAAKGERGAEDKSVAAVRERVRAGDLAAQVPALEHARDFSRALAKVSTDVGSEMGKTLKLLSTVARDPRIRAQLGLADPAFRDVFDSLVEAVGARPPLPTDKRLGVDDLLQALQAKNLPVPFDEEVLRGILGSPRPWKSLKPSAARQIAGAAASIVKMAKRLNFVATGEKLVALADAKAQIAAENGGRKDLGAPAATRSARSLGERVDAGIGAVNAWNLKPETVMQTLGPTMHGVFLKSIEGRNLKQQMQGEILRHFQEHVKEIGWMKEPLKGGTSLRMPKLGDAVVAPPPEDLAQRQGSLSLSRALAKRTGTAPVEWEKLLSDSKTLDELPTVREMIEKAEAEYAKSRAVHVIPDLADKLNKETMAMAFLNLGTAGNEQRLTSGYNWSGQEVRTEIGRHLTLEQLNQLQAVLTFFDTELWPKIREHAERTTGIAPVKVQAQPVTIRFADGRSKTYAGGYFPAAPHPDAIKAQDLLKSAEAARATVSASFTKSRASQASYPLDLNWSRVGTHIDSVLHYLAYDEPVRDISKILGDGGVQSVIRHSVGDANLSTLAKWRDLLAVGRVDNTGFIDTVLRHTLRSRAIANALSFNMPIALMQASHIPYAVTAGEISATNAALAAQRQMPFRASWTNLRDELSELRFRSTRWADQYREALSGKSAFLTGKVGREIDHLAFLHMEAADAMVAHIIGDAALNDALDRDMSREAAREYANAKIRLLMPTHNTFEMAPIARNPGIAGAVSLFRGLPNVVWNVNYGLYDRSRQAWNAAQRPALPQESTVEMEEQPDGSFGVKARAGAFAATNAIRMIAASAVLGVVGYFLAGHGKEKDDGKGWKGWGKWAARNAIGSQLEALPGARDLGQPFIDAAVKGKSVDWALHELRSGRTVPELEVVNAMLADLGKTVSHKSAAPQKAQGATNATMTFLGFGARPLTAAGANAAHPSSKMRRPRGGFDRASQVVYPTRTREETPLNLLQDLISRSDYFHR